MTSILNLTRDECASRSDVIAVDTYHIALDLQDINKPEVTTYSSVTTITFSSKTAKTWVDLVADKVHSVTVNGKSHDVEYDGARVALSGLDTSSPNKVTVDASCKYSRTGEGLHRFTDSVDGRTYAYTHFEPTDARRVYACFEQPDLKGRITFQITAPADALVFSNQSIASDVPKADNDKLHVVTFNPTLPLSTYLTSLAVGPYHVETDVWTRGEQKVELGAICRQSMVQHLESEDIFRITKQGLDFFDDAFKYPYPWGKYDSIFLPEYNIGAMEHPGLVTFNENAYIFRGTPSQSQRQSRAEVILHEMTHMWFGDLATPRWWDGTWLKESFADLMGHLAAGEAAGFGDSPWVSFGLSGKQRAYALDLRPTTHPVVADVPDLESARQNFDSITYSKGASVLRQLMAFAGREPFFKASQAYFQKHAFGATTLDDLISCLKDASEADLSQWVPTWLETTGPSIITTVRDGDKLFIETESLDVLTNKAVPRNHRVSVSTFARGSNGVERTATVSVLLDGPRVEVPLPAGTKFDLVIANDEDLTYGLLRFDDASVAVLKDHLSTVQPTLTRTVAWSGLWNMVRDAKLPALTYLDAIVNNTPAETDSGLLSLLLSQANSAITSYLAPAKRASAADKLFKTIEAGLRAAEPGSDLQRSWANALSATGALTTAETATAALRTVLDGKIAGLELTPTRRWNLVVALATLGAVGPKDLDAEYERDKTMTGATALARAQASLPGSETKHRVWKEVTESKDLTNDRQGALLAGFNAGDPAIRAEFAEPFFAAVLGWWEAKSMTMAQRLVWGLFPSTSIEQGHAGKNTVELRAQKWLDDNAQAPRALRRMITESLDNVRRDLLAQAL